MNAMTTVRRILVLFVSLLMTALLVLAGWSGPALAVQTDCHAGQLCLWTDYYGFGSRWTLYVSSMRGGLAVPPGFRGAVSSVKNNTGWTALLYNNASCIRNSATLAIGSGQYVGDLSVYNFDNVPRAVASTVNRGSDSTC